MWFKLLFCVLMYFEVQQLGSIAIKSQFENTNWISFTSIGNILLLDAFSAGLFLAVGIVHILPEANEILLSYTSFPLAFLITVIGFSMILFIEKIMFRNVEENESFIELNTLDQNKNNNGTVYLDNFDHQHTNQLLHSIRHNKNNLKPFLLSAAIGLHAIFEGIALGVSRTNKDTLALGFSLMAHKWAEGWALGVAFREQKIEVDVSQKFIIIQAALSPLGILLGMIISGESQFITGIVQALTSGTFIYIASTELIVEEFNLQGYKLIKYGLYLLGIILMSTIVYFE